MDLLLCALNKRDASDLASPRIFVCVILCFSCLKCIYVIIYLRACHLRLRRAKQKSIPIPRRCRRRRCGRDNYAYRHIRLDIPYIEHTKHMRIARVTLGVVSIVRDNIFRLFDEDKLHD